MMKRSGSYMIYGNKPLLRGLIFLTALSAAVWTAAAVAGRISREAANNTVEICLDWDEASALCALNGYPLGDFLERCGAIGASSVLIGEETVSTLSASGEIIYFPAEDYSRVSLLDVITLGSMVSANLIASKDQAVLKNMSAMLKARYGIGSALRKGGKYYLLYPEIDRQSGTSFWDESVPVGFSEAKIKYLGSKGLKSLLKISGRGDPSWMASVSTGNVSGLIWDGEEIPGNAGREGILRDMISAKGLKYIVMEFDPVLGEGFLQRALPRQLVRGHTVREAELARNRNPSFWLQRWTRSVKERNIRFLYFRFWKNMPIEENIAYLRLVAKNLKAGGYRLGTAAAPDYPDRGNKAFWVLLALVIGAASPLAGLKLALGRGNYITSFAKISAASMLGGLLISAALYDINLMQKTFEIPMVRPFFFVPIILSVFLLFSADQLRSLWNAKLEIKHLAIVAGITAAAVVVYIRSGNSAADWMVPDHGFRQVLENILSIRPRTKEFIIGHPLLLLGLYLRNPWLVLFGMIGQASIINTFLHAHSPFMISFIRTLYGLLFGFAGGTALVAAHKLYAKVRGRGMAG